VFWSEKPKDDPKPAFPKVKPELDPKLPKLGIELKFPEFDPKLPKLGIELKFPNKPNDPKLGTDCLKSRFPFIIGVGTGGDPNVILQQNLGS
jgi:hypothetical protein